MARELAHDAIANLDTPPDWLKEMVNPEANVVPNVEMVALKDLRKFRDLIGFALWQAIQLPETDPRRDYIRQANELVLMIDSQKQDSVNE
ncbi:hypothetical protein [Xanthomonas sp. LMG 12461]|uniref:hypothetical protein n=1 Tax=Xanthomonas sp. LMG 12461 TaxID=2014543 RepID=UPI0012655F4F|nr:hypothetical protein [Xanthomonas sp. LMG 12461]